MKKFTSIFTAVIAVIAILCSSILPALASVKDYTQDYLNYTDGSKYYVSTEYDEEQNCYVYRYDGGGIVTKWEFVGLIEGVDYDVYAMGEAHIAIRYIAEKKEFSDINLTVNFDRWQTALYVQDITVYVNGLRNFGDIHSELGEEADSHKFTYSGKGTVVDWEFPNLIEGVNYEVLKKEGNSITLRLINGQNEIPYLNAFVDFVQADEMDFNSDDKAPVNIKVESSVSTDSTEVTEKLPSTSDSDKEAEDLSAPTDTNVISDNTESGVQNTIIICIAVGVCSAAVAGIIVFAVMKKRKNA